MIVIDRLLVGGLSFVLDKLAVAVDRELNNEESLREELLAAQMQLELGELSDDEFATIEDDVVERLREIRRRREEEAGVEAGSGLSIPAGQRVVGAEVTVAGDEE